ncbi:tetratricopeptide repeat protein [Streptomyces populi]|uniref:Tetratricopeptide repeat protein n=1 Tax=Streptomyces populi TaxID=2058924 RepID=A0A2I0SBM7_9ACTN|nr:tetratricopeptide repeat protein [Streptomyces populi]
MSARDTGDAHAQDGGTAVSGYQGPAPSGEGTPMSTQATNTGNATATGDGAIANTGILTIRRSSPQKPAAWPHQVGTIPRRVELFQPRAEAARLGEALQDGGTAVLGQVLTGMGGVGKTQLAADHARTLWRDGAVDVLVWVTAANRTAVVASYAQAGVELCRADPNDPERAAAAFLAWLEPKKNAPRCRWLVVLDDITDPADLVGLWPSASALGQVVATTRSREAALNGTGRRLIEVGLFTPAEALAYLTKALAAHGRTEPDGQLIALAQDLGHLPLALSQAAAYLADADTTAAHYRILLADRAIALADAAPDTLPDDQHHTVAAALTLSLDRADTLRPAGLARPVLHFAAFLDANGIPLTVLTSPPALDFFTAHRTPTGSQAPGAVPARVGESEVVAALRALHRLHLVDHTSSTPHQAVRVHQLTQHAVRDTLTPDQHDTAARTAADALVAAWPEVETDPVLAQTLRACATTLFGHAEDALYRTDAHPLLLRHGRSMDGAGLPAEAFAYFTRYIDTARRCLGPNHRDTLTARYRAAGCQARAGDVPAAVEALAALLEAHTRVLGADDVDTLRTRSSLAALRTHNDRSEELKELLALLGDQVRVLGPDHCDVHDTMRRVCILGAELGHREQAITQLTELLAWEEEGFGADDPATQATREALAALGTRGEPTASDPDLTQLAEVLDDQTRVLGPNHRDTLATRRMIALAVGKAGRYTEAVDLLVELLGDENRALGPDDRDSFATLSMIGGFRMQSHGPAAGVETSRELLARQIRILGPDHIDTLSTRGDLANWLGFATSAADAVVAEAELITDLVRVVGPDHQTTVGVLGELDDWQRQSRTKRELAATMRESYETLVTIAGPADPSTVQAAGQLAQLRADEGDRRAAATALEQTLAALVERLGPDHPAVAAVRANLNFWRKDDALCFTGSADEVAYAVTTTPSGHPSTALKSLDARPDDLLAKVDALDDLLANVDDDPNTTLTGLDVDLTTPTGTAPDCPDPYAIVPFEQGHRATAAATPAFAPVPAAVPPMPTAPPTVAAPAATQSAETQTLHLVAGQNTLLPAHAIQDLLISFTAAGTPADLTLLLTGPDGKVASDDDFVFYNQPQIADGACRLLPEQTADGRRAGQATVALARLPEQTRRVVISINMDVETGAACDELVAPVLTVEAGNQTWTFEPQRDPEIKAMIVVEFYRHSLAGQEVWKLRAVGQGWADGLAGLARDYGVTVD